jgi:hypothetical protein
MKKSLDVIDVTSRGRLTMVIDEDKNNMMPDPRIMIFLSQEIDG